VDDESHAKMVSRDLNPQVPLLRGSACLQEVVYKFVDLLTFRTQLH